MDEAQDQELREQFTFYASFFRSIARIKKKADRADAYDAICAYALSGAEPDLDKMADSAAIAFIGAKPNLDASRRKAANGKKGGSAKQSPSKPEANGKQSESKKENEIEKEKEKEYECTPPTPSEGEKKASRFVKPTVEEVRLYCQENGYGVDPQRFVDHYTANGWKVGKNPMKDWKAAVRTWVKNQGGQSKPAPGRTGTGGQLLDMINSGVFDE